MVSERVRARTSCAPHGVLVARDAGEAQRGAAEGHDAAAHLVLREARVAGTVNGSSDAGTLSIERSASISGDIAYDALDMAAGARVDGRLQHKAADASLKLVASKAD